MPDSAEKKTTSRYALNWNLAQNVCRTFRTINETPNLRSFKEKNSTTSYNIEIKISSKSEWQNFLQTFRV